MRFAFLFLAFFAVLSGSGFSQSTSTPSPWSATEEKIIGRWKNDTGNVQFYFLSGGKVRFDGKVTGWWKVINKQQVQFNFEDEHGTRTGNLNLACTEISYETQDKKSRRAIYMGK